MKQRREDRPAKMINLDLYLGLVRVGSGGEIIPTYEFAGE